MFGPYGTQKTHLAQWAGISLLKKGFSVRYSSMQRLVSNLSSEFDSNLEKQKLVEELLSVDCLILDECFSKTKVTLYRSGYQLPFLETFLRERMEHRQKAIIFISNNTLDEIASQGFGESIEDFVKRNIRPKGTELKFTDSYRANVSTIDVDNIFKE
jgi:DNA replication protein DnaC